jgi:hypothetical protein
VEFGGGPLRTIRASIPSLQGKSCLVVFYECVLPKTDHHHLITTTRLFLTLSAFLAEATGDSKYTNAAILSAQWIQSLQINSQGIVLDTVSGHDCSRSPSNWLFTYNSGKFIEGLSVLAHVTGNASWNQLYVALSPAQGSDCRLIKTVFAVG